MAINQLQHAHGLLVYPSDVYTLSYQFNSTTQSSNLYVGTGGNVRILTYGGDDVTLYNVQSGSFLPVHAKKVFLTGTTASNILAMDMNLTGGGMNQETFAYLSATGITGDTEVSAINTLVSSLKLNGLWSKMKAVYPFVTDNRNLLGYTQAFDNAAWTKTSITLVADSTTAPDGTTTADTIQNQGNYAYIRQAGVALSNITYTQSCYFKKNNNNWVAMYTSDGGSNYAIAYFNINTGVVGTASASGNFSNVSSSISSAPNGYYRCVLTFTKPSSASSETSIIVPDADNTLNRTAGQNVYLWGAQLELGSTATTYQPIATTQQSYISNQFKYNLVNPVDSDAAFRGVFNGGWTFSNQGAFTNGVNSYVDTKLNPLTVFSTNYSSFSAYWRNTFSAGQTNIFGACASNQIDFRMDMGYDSGVTVPFVATANTNSDLGVATSNTGFNLATRQGASVSKMFRNGSLLINGTKTFTAHPNFNFYLGSRNFAGTPQGFNCNQQYAFAHIGDGLTDTEATALYNAVQSFNSSLNRAVAP